MAYDQQLATAVSDTFRAICNSRLSPIALSRFETLIFYWGLTKNIRNVQLWTRYGAQQRQFLNRNLGQGEMSFRYFVANKFIQNIPPAAPVKTHLWTFPITSIDAQKIFFWLNDEWIRAYCTRLIVTDYSFVIEYLVDSDTPLDEGDIDSPEFDDLLE